eukprot:TRINITY_DN2055_c0_g1_i1.p1 TRINITY_DN2055_c0_g1~~TRINITY_DN2055_c0_g1_i1.p1  ORF type:complete len:264 (-),score=55.60 TRINITY_DN2055_c0_g1_i1:277-1002(-)
MRRLLKLSSFLPSNVNHISVRTMSTVSREIDAEHTVLFVCDIQETFRKVIPGMNDLLLVSKFMMNSAKTLNIPIVATEQIPFKPTCSELDVKDLSMGLHKKTQFSMLTKEVRDKIRDSKSYVRHVLLIGIEAHVCVLQTALDLLRDERYDVYLVTDCLASQRPSDKQTAFERLQSEGAILTSSESIIYEIMKDAKNPAFRTVLQHVKTLAKERAAATAAAASSSSSQSSSSQSSSSSSSTA